MQPISPLENDSAQACFCHSGKAYTDCCQPYHQNTQIPLTAEALMRSRFSAFALASKYAKEQALVTAMQAYLFATWHESTRPDPLELDLSLVWTKLHILGRKEGKKRHQKGWIRFNAHYQTEQGQKGVLSENSEFIKQAGRWFYLQGDVLQE